MSIRNFISKKLVDPLLLKYAKNPSWPWYSKLLKLDQASRQELLEDQWQSFQSMFEYARKYVPYYADSFGRQGIKTDDLTNRDLLLAIPTISKQQIASNFPDRITSSKSDRATWQYLATSGTTDRLMVVTDIETSSRNEALSLYGHSIRGTYNPGSLKISIPPDACSLVCAVNVQRTQTIKGRVSQSLSRYTQNGIAGISRSAVGSMLRKISQPGMELPSFGTTGTRVAPELMQWYIDTIRRRRPFVLSGLPTYLQLLARHIERSQATPPAVGSLLPEGSLSAPSLKSEISRAFNAPVHEVYGAHELGSVASSCEKQNKLHVNMPGFLVETVKDGKNVAPGELGEIVITSFINAAMPLIRYKPGDVGRLYEERCSCGRQSQLLSVEGRLQDTIITSKGIFTSQKIADFLVNLPNIEFCQLVQQDDVRCDMLIVEKERGQTNKNDVSDAVQAFLGEKIKIRPRIVSTIKPEASGKFRFVKSKSYQYFHTDVVANGEVVPWEYKSGSGDEKTEEIVDAVFN